MTPLFSNTINVRVQEANQYRKIQRAARTIGEISLQAGHQLVE
jgi:hypothetical protein